MWVELNLQLNLNFINIDFGRWTKLFTPFLISCVQVHLALPLSVTFLLVWMTGLTSYVLLLTPQMEWGLCWEEWSGLVGSILSKYNHKYMALWFERTWLRYRIFLCPSTSLLFQCVHKIKMTVCIALYPQIEYTEQANICTVHLINDGVTISGNTATVEFASTGPSATFLCSLDRQDPVSCMCIAKVITRLCLARMTNIWC